MPERQISMREAINEALCEEMRRDPRVFLMGEDIGRVGGVFKLTAGLYDEFGPQRVRDTPISEAGIVGLAVGAAITGLRPVVEIMFNDFLTLAMDQIVNQAAKLRYMTGGQTAVPLVIRAGIGAGRRAAAQHSQSLQAWFCHIPGLKVVMPATPKDMKGLLKTAIRDDNPVIFLEDKMMYGVTGPVPDEEYTIPFGKAEVCRSGTDVTIVATSSMVYEALEAADTLAQAGIEAEVINPLTLVPLDADALISSAVKTGHVIVVDEGHQSYGITAEIAARVGEGAFDYLDAPVVRIGALDVPVPFNPTLEELTIPSTDRIAQAAQELLA